MEVQYTNSSRLAGIQETLALVQSEVEALHANGTDEAIVAFAKKLFGTGWLEYLPGVGQNQEEEPVKSNEVRLFLAHLEQFKIHVKKLKENLLGHKKEIKFPGKLSIEGADISFEGAQVDNVGAAAQIGYKVRDIFQKFKASLEELDIHPNRASSVAPIRGIKNPKNDCFYISLLQLMAGPEFDELFKVEEGDEEDQLLRDLQDIRQKINTASDKPLDKLLRRFRTALGLPDHTQEDITEVFLKLIDHISRQSDAKKQLIEKILGIIESDRTTLLEVSGEKVDGCPIENAAEYHLDPDTRRGQKVSKGSLSYILKPIIVADGGKTFNGIEDWLSCPQNEESTSINVYIPEEGEQFPYVRKATKIERRQQFETLPPLLVVSPIRRGCSNGKPTVIEHEYEMPPQFSLRDLKGKKHYELSSFSVRRSSFFSSEGGHYYSYRKIDKVWYKINDDTVDNLQNKEGFVTPKDVVEKRKEGYFFVYKQVKEPK